MSRLTRRAEADGVKAVWYGNREVFLDGETGYAEADKLAHYEDLKEAGRLIELPCKIGDKVYDISDVLNGDESDLFEIDVKWITLEEDENGKLYFAISGFDYYPEAFGNVAFLTEEEAYAELSRIFQAMQDELEAEAEWVAMEGGE